jgi:2'-phosphotransferase
MAGMTLCKAGTARRRRNIKRTIHVLSFFFNIMLKNSSRILSAVNREFAKGLTPRITIQRPSHSRGLYDMADSETPDLVTMSQDLDLGEKSARGNKRGEKGGRGGKQKQSRSAGQGGGDRVENREVMVSKALSKLLRHAAEDVGLALDPEGFARVDQVVSP